MEEGGGSSGEKVGDARYECEPHEDSLYTSRDDYAIEESEQELDENLETRVQKYSKEYKSTLEKMTSQISKKGENSDRGIKDGAVTMIYHEYPDGRIKAIFEEKPKGYKAKEAEGKLAFIGGEMESYDLSSKHTAAREISEEFYDKDVIRILLNNLEEDGELYRTITRYDANGKQFKVYIHPIKVKTEKEWEKVERASLKECYLRALPLDEVLNKNDNEYAFGYGIIVKKFFKERHPTQSRLALYGDYSLPIVSTSCIHLQTIDSFINKSQFSLN